MAEQTSIDKPALTFRVVAEITGGAGEEYFEALSGSFTAEALGARIAEVLTERIRSLMLHGRGLVECGEHLTIQIRDVDAE